MLVVTVTAPIPPAYPIKVVATAAVVTVGDALN
jgi:hypothetical protein